MSEGKAIPRNIKLYLEYLECYGGNCRYPNISVGYSDKEDRFFHNWDAMYIERDLNAKIYVSDQYPEVPPEITFCTKVNFPFVDSNNKVIPSKIPLLNNWKREYDLREAFHAVCKAINGK